MQGTWVKALPVGERSKAFTKLLLALNRLESKDARTDKVGGCVYKADSVWN